VNASDATVPTNESATTNKPYAVDSVASAPKTSTQKDTDRTITTITNTNSEHVLNTSKEAHTFMQVFFTTFANTLRHVVSLFT